MHCTCQSLKGIYKMRKQRITYQLEKRIFLQFVEKTAGFSLDQRDLASKLFHTFSINGCRSLIH